MLRKRDHFEVQCLVCGFPYGDHSSNERCPQFSREEMKIKRDFLKSESLWRNTRFSEKPETPKPRKIIQIATMNSGAPYLKTSIIALCDDGTVYGSVHSTKWERIADIPQDEPDNPQKLENTPNQDQPPEINPKDDTNVREAKE